MNANNNYFLNWFVSGFSDAQIQQLTNFGHRKGRAVLGKQ